jgi:hypothetical protein
MTRVKTWDEAVELAERAYWRHLRGDETRMGNALRALTAAGVAFVPREATREMLDAAGAEYVPWTDAVRCWGAALSAGEIAPPPPADAKEGQTP